MNASVDVTLDSLLDKLWRDRGWDFREYKRGTLTRRAERRLLATGAATYQDYMSILDSRPGEYQLLRNCLTITVSSFFRSPDTFQQLARVILPALIAEKAAIRQNEIRIWSAACACGEEPYSIAIALREFVQASRADFRAFIYATDVSQPALEKAAAGLFPADKVTGIPVTILKGYFTRHSYGYVINDDLREMVAFSWFDLTSAESPPLTNLDIVFCCNVLIYLQRDCQERVVDMLYRSLATPGYLVLGEAETPPGKLNLKLECLDSKARIYRKRLGGA